MDGMSEYYALETWYEGEWVRSTSSNLIGDLYELYYRLASHGWRVRIVLATEVVVCEHDPSPLQCESEA